MAQVFLTEDQRMKQRYADLRDCLGARLAASMKVNRMKVMETAGALQIGHSTLTKIMRGEEVRLDTTTWLKILDVAGLKLTDRKKDAIRGEAEK
jgi:predicted transcriptional regulator